MTALSYQVPFHPARGLDFFQRAESLPEIDNALKTDLPSFIPLDILSAYQTEGFSRFSVTLHQVCAQLQAQDLCRIYLK